VREEKLTGSDYFKRSRLELSGHSDFNEEAYEIVNSISKMTTEQIVDFILEDSNG
jgi:hypothetical protein